LQLGEALDAVVGKASRGHSAGR